MTTLRRETILYAAATTVGGMVVLAFLPFMSTELTAGQAGQVGSLRTLSDVIAGIAVLGLPSGILRFWQDGVTSRRALAASSALLPLGAALVMGLLLLFSGDWICRLLQLESPSLLVHAYLLGTGAALVQSLLAPLRAEGRAGTFLAVQAARGAASVAMLAVLLSSSADRVPAFLSSRWAPALAASVAAAALLVPLARKGGPGPKGLLSFSLPLVPAGLALLVLSSADMVMLRAMCPDLDQSGYYEWATSACMSLTPITLGFGMAWQRHIFRDRGSRGDLGSMGRTSLQFVLLTLWAASVLALCAPELVRIVGGGAYGPAAEVVPVLAGANALYALYLVSQTGPMLQGQTGWIAVATILGAAANILFNARLIPLYGAQGAALATLGTNLFMAGSLFWVGRRAFPVSLPIIALLMLAAAALGPAAGMSQALRMVTLGAVTLACISMIMALRRAG